MLSPTSPQPTLDPDQRIVALEQKLSAVENRLTNLEKNSIRLDKVLQPRVGFAAGCVFAAAFTLFCFAVFKGQELYHYLSYFVPIVLPFIGFVFERLYRYVQKTPRGWGVLAIALDIIVLAASLIRSVYALPFISGHVLFLTFALLTVKSWWVRIPVVAVLIEVIYLKAFVWHDSTLYGGALLGCLAAVVWWGITKVSIKSRK